MDPIGAKGEKFTSELFSSKRLESYEYIRVEERRAFISRLHRMIGNPVTLKDHLSHTAFSVIIRIVLGMKYFNEPGARQTEIVNLEEFQEMLDELFLLNCILNIGDWTP